MRRNTINGATQKVAKKLDKRPSKKHVRGRPEPTAHDVAFKRIDGAGRYFGSVTR
jgi:hypothetical protein